VKALVFILILTSLFVTGCKDHDRSQLMDRPEVVIDPWVPPGYNDMPDYQMPDDYVPPVEPPHNDEQPVPEPSTMILVGSGIAIMYIRSRKNDKQK